MLCQGEDDDSVDDKDDDKDDDANDDNNCTAVLLPAESIADSVFYLPAV